MYSQHPYPLPGRRGSWSSDVGAAQGFSDSDSNVDFLRLAQKQTVGEAEAVAEANVVTPEKDLSIDYESEEEGMFEPYHDAQTNRTIMRMRMGSLMDGEDEEEIPLASERKETTMLTLLEQADKFSRSFFFPEDYGIQEEDEETPFDQVIYNDPYNAWDLPTATTAFLASPYSLFENKRKKGNNISSLSSSPRTKTTFINKQGFLESSAPSISDPPFNNTSPPDSLILKIDEKIISTPSDSDQKKVEKTMKTNLMMEEDAESTMIEEETLMHSAVTSSLAQEKSPLTITESTQQETTASPMALATKPKPENEPDQQQVFINNNTLDIGDQLRSNESNQQLCDQEGATYTQLPDGPLSSTSTPHTILSAVSNTESLSASSPSSSPAPIQSVLIKYKDMIAAKVNTLPEVRAILQQDPKLSEREADAFIMGVELAFSRPSQEHQKRLSQELTTFRQPNISPQKTRSEIASTTSNNSLYSTPRMKARASKRSVTLDPNMSTFMALLKNESFTSAVSKVRGVDDAKTSISVMSTLSCRELSIQRLRRQISSNRQKEKHEVERLLRDLQDAQTRQTRLEQQLSKAGISIAEDIPYSEAKEQVTKIASQMQAIGHSKITHNDPKQQQKLRQEYFVLEQQMEKYMRALELTDEYLQEQDRLELEFDSSNHKNNMIALSKIWTHMPVNIRQKSVDEWLEIRTPSGKFPIRKFLIKFSRTNILTLLRMNPNFVERAHPSNLEQRRVTGLTLTERRALQAFLQPIANRKWRKSKDPLTKRKWNWYCILRQTFKHHLISYQHHVAQHDQDDSGRCTCQSLKCPVKANTNFDYFEFDYGYPANVKSPEYEVECHPTSFTVKQAKSSPKGSFPRNTKRTSFLEDVSKVKLKAKVTRKNPLMQELAERVSQRNLEPE
jgi:hypothetical protein